MIYLILVMLLVGCAKSEGTPACEVPQQSEFMMTAEKVEGCVYRYENEEVVCYAACRSGDIYCKWKESK